MEKLTLQDVELFGGTKEDLQLLDGVDENCVEDIVFSDGEGVDDESRMEIESFIGKLGLGRPDSTSKSRKKTQDTETKIFKEPPTAAVDRKKGKKPRGDLSEKKEKHRTELPPCIGGGPTDVQLEKMLLTLSAKLYKKPLVSLDSEQPLLKQNESSTAAHPVSPHVLIHLMRVGEELMQTQVELYEKARQKRKSAGDLKWIKTVLSSGTLSDKMAARTLLIQESPFHTLNSLDSLLTMASKKGRRECVFAADTLKELCVTNLLPDDRKLKSLKQRPLSELVSSGQSVQSCHTKLLLWYHEDQLKTRYAKFLDVMKVLLHDSVANIREKMLGHVFDLLYHKPEQEQELLSQLVNKMGDPVRKIASKASLFILKLLNQHVNMKVVVASELERLLYRPNIQLKAQYYCVCCLNQFTIVGNDDVLAVKLIDIYFTFFKLYVKRGELDAKMLGALLTGVNRAFPFLKGEIPSFEDHMQSLFTVVHVGPLATGIQSLLLLYQVMESRQAISGRYYQALYAKLMDPALKYSTKQGVFLNLLFKSLRSDPEMNRVKAFLKRILQISSLHSPSFLCGCLYLISELLKLKAVLWAFILQPESSDNEHFIDLPNTQPLTLETFNADTDINNNVIQSQCEKPRAGSQYRVACRNPLYSRAETSCLWELSRLLVHYHPSVQAFANKIYSGKYIDYKGDPLQDFTMMHFLDRFVYKNPKQRKESDHGGSLMQKTSKLLSEESKRNVPVNSPQFMSMRADKVREDELFMHKYFVQKATLGGQRNTNIVIEGIVESKAELSVSQQDEDSLDFASEFEKEIYRQRQPKMRKGSKESGSDGESIEESSDENDNDSLIGSHDDVSGGGGDATEVEMEKLLMEQLSSDSDLESDEQPRTKKLKSGELETAKQFDINSMFVAAEEFSHLIEESVSTRKQDKNYQNKKQLLWERKKVDYRKFKSQSRLQNRAARKKTRKT